VRQALPDIVALNNFFEWWAVQDLNLWPPPCEGGAIGIFTFFIYLHFTSFSLTNYWLYRILGEDDFSLSVTSYPPLSSKIAG